MAAGDELAVDGRFEPISQVMYPWMVNVDGELWNLGQARRIRVKQGMVVAEYPDVGHVVLYRHTDEAKVQEEFNRIKTWIARVQTPMFVFSMDGRQQDGDSEVHRARAQEF